MTPFTVSGPRPWLGRNPADWHEAEIASMGGLYGWDHRQEANPIPAARRCEREGRLIAQARPVQLALVAEPPVE